jgi:hypothetical protein
VHPATLGPFGVLAFPHSDDDDLVYVEGYSGDLYLEKERDVEVYEQMFDNLVEKSMTADQSAAFITKFLLDH